MIISVHSFRGGTGKSNLTANLAVMLADAGRRVGVVDTDIQSPGIHVLFGLGETSLRRSLNDYLWGQCTIEEAACPVAASPDLFLIPSSLRAGDIARILREGYDVGRLNDGLRQAVIGLRLDYLLIDTHPGVNEETLLSIALSDHLVILLRPDQQDYLGTAVTVDLARRLGVPSMMLVVNKVLPSLDAATVRRQMEQTYGAPVAGLLPLCEEMVRLGSGDLFCRRYPDHPLTLEVRAVARRLAG